MPRLIPICMLLFLTSPALAAPWQLGMTDPDDPTYLAYQEDTESGAILIIDCYEMLASSGIWVLANKAWEETTSYAPFVEPVFTVDGVGIVAPKFHFYEYHGREGIYAGPLSEFEAFSSIYSAIFYAEQSIAVSYFDKRATFSAEGVMEVETVCGVERPDP